jgi:hypothetical protein
MHKVNFYQAYNIKIYCTQAKSRSLSIYAPSLYAPKKNNVMQVARINIASLYSERRKIPGLFGQPTINAQSC